MWTAVVVVVTILFAKEKERLEWPALPKDALTDAANKLCHLLFEAVTRDGHLRSIRRDAIGSTNTLKNSPPDFILLSLFFFLLQNVDTLKERTGAHERHQTYRALTSVMSGKETNLIAELRELGVYSLIDDVAFEIAVDIYKPDWQCSISRWTMRRKCLVADDRKFPHFSNSKLQRKNLYSLLMAHLKTDP